MKLRKLLVSRPLRYASATLLLAAVCAGALVMNGRSGQSVSAAPAIPAPSINGRHAATGPEALLSRTLHEVGNRRLDAAVSEIDKVIQGYPNFRLAHLIKGDLLLARARPLTTVGNASGAHGDRLEEFRAEARARLARIQSQRPDGLVPRYMVQMQPEQRHALVVDTARSTLYVFENRNGEARYVTDYYISIGKNGIDKFREGDNKTPLGVYHVTGRLSREKLSATYGKLAKQYGVGALPISYPNEWDRREGRNGFGIWLHGVPFDTYSRPPRASNGCVALTNEDFTAISRDIQIGLTPVIIANGVDWVAPGANRIMRQELMQRVENWRRDWENRDTEQYLAHYAAGFSTGKMGLAQWSRQKHKINAGKAWIRLKLDKVSIFLYPGRDDLAVVTFDQDYASSNLINQMRKRQYWIRESGAWRILHEGSA
ncbi:MAG TPA: L,D-transpeptidase family protein [Burkholderiales bacterium]|nr:L,D-transpeptidase family protein [Burkholderiales bacterium]